MVKFYQGVKQDLTLYARQLGWLHAIPEMAGPEKGIIKTRQTRLEKIQANGGQPRLPVLNEASYLADYWHHLGYVTSSPMGAMKLSPVDIRNWQRGMCIHLNVFEFDVLLSMSRQYLEELHIAAKPDAIPPFGTESDNFDPKIVAKKINDAFKNYF